MIPTALLIDKDPNTLVAIPDALQCRLPRLRIDTTTDVVDALGRLEVKPYSVVLTDLRLSHMDGQSFLQEVKRRQAETPVVVLSDTNDQALVGHAFQPEIFDFLPKPLDRDDLSTTVQLAMYAYHLERDLKASQERLRRHFERLRRVKGETPEDITDDVKKLGPEVVGHAGVGNRACASLADVEVMVLRNKLRLHETEQLLSSVHRIARQRGHTRAIRRKLLD